MPHVVADRLIDAVRGAVVHVHEKRDARNNASVRSTRPVGAGLHICKRMAIDYLIIRVILLFELRQGLNSSAFSFKKNLSAIIPPCPISKISHSRFLFNSNKLSRLYPLLIQCILLNLSALPKSAIRIIS